jgi:hypothetical protein
MKSFQKDNSDDAKNNESFDDTLTVSSLKSVEKQKFKTSWPSDDAIEKLTGIKIKRPEQAKVPEENKLDVSIAVIDRPKSKLKKSATKMPTDKKATKGKSPTPSLKASTKKDSLTVRTPEPVVNKLDETEKDQLQVSVTNMDESHLVAPMSLPVIEISSPINEIVDATENELPKTLCPSSMAFSKKLAVQMWIKKSHFEKTMHINPNF